MIEALKMSPLGGAGFSQSLGQAANAAKTAVANPVVDFASQLAQTVRAGESAVVSGIKGDMPLQQVVETVMTAERTLTTAVLEELVGFCPSPRDRANLGRVLQATNRVLDKARDLTEKRIQTLTSESELDRLVNRMVPPIPEPPTPGSSSTSAPELSASIPGP